MNDTESTPTMRHFSARASLAAVGTRLRSLRLCEMFAEHVHINQKTIRHTPAEKLYDALIAILAGAHGLSEINRAWLSGVEPRVLRFGICGSCAIYSASRAWSRQPPQT